MQLFGKVLENEIRAASLQRKLVAEQVLTQPDSYVCHVPLVLTGSLRVVRQDDQGREMLLYYIRPGESCIMSFLAGIHENKSKVRLVAEEDSELLLIPSTKAGAWVRTYAEWASYVFKLYQNRFEELLDVIDAVSFQRLDDRILRLLNKKAAIHGANELVITHQQLAVELGTTREVISRLLKQMEKQNLVSLSRNRIIFSGMTRIGLNPLPTPKINNSFYEKEHFK